jgi:hypothetical protein
MTDLLTRILRANIVGQIVEWNSQPYEGSPEVEGALKQMAEILQERIDNKERTLVAYPDSKSAQTDLQCYESLLQGLRILYAEVSKVPILERKANALQLQAELYLESAKSSNEMNDYLIKLNLNERATI